MEKFDINKVLDAFKPNEEEIAKLLFPDVNYPKKAFARIKSGESQLDIDQVARLADSLGVSVQMLLGNNFDGYRVVFTRGQYRAVISHREPKEMELFYKGQLLCLWQKFDGKSLKDIFAFIDARIEENEKVINKLSKDNGNTI